MDLLTIIDIDDTICNTVPVWIRKYNRKYNDKLKISQIQDWNLAKYTVPECGDKIYDILEQGNLYKFVKQIPYALEGITKLRSLGANIIYATGGSPKASVHKYEWLKENGFFHGNDHYIQTVSKHLIKGDLMIDDNYSNIIKFQGYGLLFNQPWNLKYTYGNRTDGWKSIINDINKYLESK
jgi:5'(3')-deoxyribonucleotidase